MKPDATAILVTGATGFLGRAIVRGLSAQGCRVVAVSRGRGDLPADVIHHEIDLAAPEAASALADVCSTEGVVSIIHLAGAMAADDAAHLNQTVRPTEMVVRLARALPRGKGTPTLVLASSFSVYSYAGQPVGTMLDETAPTEGAADRRDAYARAKLAQEACVVQAVQSEGLIARILRPGAIIGPGREWTSRIGFTKGPLTILLGGRARLPLIDVEPCADAFIRAAMMPVQGSDVLSASDGRLEYLNVVGDEQPAQREYLAALRRKGRVAAKVVVPVPWRLLEKASDAVGVALDVGAPLSRHIPTILRPETLHARAKPLRYSNARLKSRLGWTDQTGNTSE